MSYEQLAYVYDHFMEEAPYAEWLAFVRQEMKQFGPVGNKLLDVACGTGEFGILAAKSGLDVTGIDLSEEMLAMAAEKADKAGIRLPLVQQDMSNLAGLPSFDVVTLICDSLNYLETPEAVQTTFAGCCRQLAKGGLFIFDVHSVHQINHEFIGRTFTWNSEDVAYIWESYAGEYPDSVEHDITFFVRDNKTGLFRRMDECHKQRTYPVDTFKLWIEEAGLTLLRVSADFSDQGPVSDSKRIFFTCQKR